MSTGCISIQSRDSIPPVTLPRARDLSPKAPPTDRKRWALRMRIGSVKPRLHCVIKHLPQKGGHNSPLWSDPFTCSQQLDILCQRKYSLIVDNIDCRPNYYFFRTPIKTHKGNEKWPLFVNKQLFWSSASITMDTNNVVLTDSHNTSPHTSVSLTRCISIVFSVLNILTHMTTMQHVGSLQTPVNNVQ